MSQLSFYIFVTVLIVLFWGDPDLHDALIHYFMRDQNE